MSRGKVARKTIMQREVYETGTERNKLLTALLCMLPALPETVRKNRERLKCTKMMRTWAIFELFTALSFVEYCQYSK